MAEASEKFLCQEQLFIDFNQDANPKRLISEVVAIETDSSTKDTYYYPSGAINEPQGTVIALEPVELSDENDSDAPLLGTSLDSLETVGVEPLLEQNQGYTLSNTTDQAMIIMNTDHINNADPQENSLYNGSYVGSTGSDIPLLGTSPDNDNSSTADINFNSVSGTYSEPLVNPLPNSETLYGYTSTNEETSTTLYNHQKPEFVSNFSGLNPLNDAPLLGSSLVDFQTAEANNVLGENKSDATFTSSETINPLLSYFSQSSDLDQSDSIPACESHEFQEAELRQFEDAEYLCNVVNNNIQNVPILNSALICSTNNPETSHTDPDCDSPLLDLNVSALTEENPDNRSTADGSTIADSLVTEVPAENFLLDGLHPNEQIFDNRNYENTDKTKCEGSKPFDKQISTDSSAPLIEDEPIKRDFLDLEIPPNYRVIECEPSFSMSKAAPFLHLYGSSKLLSSPHCASREHVNLSDACIHMLNHLNNSYSNVSLMPISSLKDIRDIHLEKLDSESVEEKPAKHWKNLFAYSIGFMVMYMAFGSLRHLQSSLNSEAGVGLMTLSCLFAFFVIGSLFASYVVKKLEPRRATLVTVLFHLLYVISNCYPKVYILMPVSALLGFWNAVSWGASGTYIQRLACSYAMKTNQKTEHVCSKFHGIFYLIIFFSEVFGNLISSLILGSNSSAPVLIPVNNTLISFINQTTPRTPENLSDQYAHCGIFYSHSNGIDTETVKVDQTTIYILTAVFVGMDILAFFIIFFCVDPLTMYYKCESKDEVRSCWQVWQDVKAVIIFMTDWRFIMLIPLYMFSAIHIGYISADITKAFVTCFLGIHMVGYMMICYGIFDAFSSYITGWLNQITGRMLLISIGSLLFQAIILFLLLWQPNASSLVPFILIFAFWGLSDGFYASQLCSLTGVMFSETCEEAFSAYRMMQGVGLTVAYSYAPVLPLDIKLYMLSGLGIVSWVLYITMEYLNKRSIKIKDFMEKYQQTTV